MTQELVSFFPANLDENNSARRNMYMSISRNSINITFSKNKLFIKHYKY